MTTSDNSLALGAQGAAVKTLHSNLAQAGIVVPAAESEQATFSTGTREAVVQLQAQFKLPTTGALDAVSAAVLSGAASAISRGQWLVTGRVAMDYGSAADSLSLRLYTIGFGGASTALGETKTDANGAFTLSYAAQTGAPNLEVRALDLNNKEVTISQIKFGAQSRESLNLVAPSSVQPLAPEYQRLAADLTRQVGSIEKLGAAQEAGDRRDITLVSRASNWDARLVTLATLATQNARATGLSADILYGLYRTGLPTDPQKLALTDASTASDALKQASQSGIVKLSADQIDNAAKEFQDFATKTRLAMTAPGAASSFQELLNGVVSDTTQQAAFTNLFFNGDRNSPDLWAKAAKLKIPQQTIANLQLQGKLLYLTFNNAALAQVLQKQVGSLDKLSALAEAGLHDSAAWQGKLKEIAGAGGDNALAKLIPTGYTQANVADRLTAYTGDLARLVRLSFPTEVTAALLDKQTLKVARGDAGAISSFLKTAAPMGFELGRTPLNNFVKAHAAQLPALDAASAKSLKDVHRTFQLSPSNESMQVLMANGLTSAQAIVSHGKDTFLAKYRSLFPSAAEAILVFSKAQQISSVTFNFYALAKQLDNTPPVYGLSGSSDDRQAAKDAVVEQFPTMASLFGNLDFCQCTECRSVLSPAAYFVDLLEFLRQSAPNTAGYTPLDILIGKDAAVAGRRPDLAALSLTCENTNTVMPYIDLVTEIFEYYVANSHLDANAAYDTGNASMDDLASEPQHILPAVYTNVLTQAVYPLTLPFDLWIETVRGFLNYFKTPLAQVLETLRPADALGLYGDANNYPYYRAQIFAEMLGLSPSDYNVLTVTDLTTKAPSVTNWFALYGYADEATALNGKVDATDASKFEIEPLKSARNLSECLAVSYQDVVDLVGTGFLNPGLAKLTFQFDRFGISLQDAFAYTGQPGSTAMTAQAKTDFEAELAAASQKYQAINPSFDAKAWLTSFVAANYAKGVWVLDDPDTGCDFTNTTLQYADGSALAPLDYLKLNLFVRLRKKLGWTIEEIDRALQLFFPSAALPAWSNAGFAAAYSAAWKTALINLAHLDAINRRLKPAMGRLALLPFWSDLSVEGDHPLYAQLFLEPSVLNNDPAFDDPAGAFPSDANNFMSAHLPALLGVLGLTTDEVNMILNDANAATVTKVVNGQNVTAPAFTLANISICYRYSVLAKCLDMPVADLIALRGLSGLDIFKKPGAASLTALQEDALFTQTLAFLDQVSAVQTNGFDVAALQYLLRHKFDPTGPYQQDANAQLSLAQSFATGLRQIAAQNALPANLATANDDVLQQKLAAILPAQVLQTFATLIGNGQSYGASQGGVVPGSQIDPAQFAAETGLKFSYDPTTQTQTVTFQGVLLDWKKSQLLKVNNSALFSGLLDGVQAQGTAAFAASVGDLLGVWSSLIDYEAVRTGVAAAINAAPLTAADPSIRLSYDQVGQLQRLAYRGVLDDEKKAALTAIDASATLATLLADVQGQAMPTYRQFLGTVLAISAQAQSYVSVATGVPAANAIDPTNFSPYPQMLFTYDAVAQTQTLTFQGILTDADRIAIAALLPASAALPGLLQDVRNQAFQVFQKQAQHLLGVAIADLDVFAQGITGLAGSSLQRRAKAAVIQAIQPLMTHKLAQTLIVQTVSSALSAEPAFTEDLLTEATLLSDPNNAGKSLLQSYLAVGVQGVTVDYYGTPDQTGASIATGTAATVDLGDSTNPNAGKTGTDSAHFEGYLQVPTDGAYRFFAELGNANARIVFNLTSPDPTALLSNPILDAAAPKDNDEISQFVPLLGGMPYRFTADFTKLGANGASLLIQGENLPKGPLGQVILMPGEAVDALIRAETLIAKVLQILGTFGLDERELTYLAANGTRFGNLRLSTLPTLAGDDTPAGAVALFGQFLALADYAALRKGPLGGADGLISVFANVGVTYTEVIGSYATNTDPGAPWTRLANLTRRDPQIVRDVAAAFGLIKQVTSGANYQITALPEFASSRGMRRLWDALQLVQIVGIPVASLVSATLIVSPAPPASSPPPDAIAATLKNAVKARYDMDAWRPIAKSVFDKLRQKKRDALVAWLVNALQLTNSNQLFEYFLMDPGMEPVVKTSRIRLALSSVQTFAQRCLLDLENGSAHPERNVDPSAIDADWWTWMKRYRVWEANREIFLYPENWMEPELRLDKTDLFLQLESALTQGDVTRALVESAFLDYLKGLDVRARLDIVATYLDQDATRPGLSTLHVLARTYGKPHKYFLRTYANAAWSAWAAVQPDIEGDHIAIAVWRGKLNLFWLTFSKKQQSAPAPTGSDNSGAVANLTFNQLGGKIYSAAAQELLQVQLNWCEYFQGTWSDRVATDINKTETISVKSGFDVNTVHLHVSKEADDAAIRIHLDFPAFHVIVFLTSLQNTTLQLGVDLGSLFTVSANHAFRVTSRNCDPAFSSSLWSAGPSNPYNTTGIDATIYTGSTTLQASFQSQITSTGSVTQSERILQSVNDYGIVTASNAVAPPFLNPAESDYWEAGALVSPFFYNDRSHPATSSEMTFFVRPSLTEVTLQKWIGWAIPYTPSGYVPPILINKVPILAQTPRSPIPVNPPDPAFSIYPMLSQTDWVTNPATAIVYGNTPIGADGGLDLAFNASLLAAGAAQSSTVANALANGLSPSGLGKAVLNGDGLDARQLQILNAAQATTLAAAAAMANVAVLRQVGGI